MDNIIILIGGSGMSIDKVKEYFKDFGIENRILEFEVSSATVKLAAEALGCLPERIAKTLSFKNGESCLLIVAAGDARIDNSKFKSTFGFKAKMPSGDEVEKLCGHAIGGVCPFAVKDGVKVYIDISLCRFSTVFPACGSSNSAIEMTIQELEKYSNCIEIIDVCKDWQ
jgi:prolyl-tRNA editing enzyme YbaK/EbsC (Cys-tRNA(Pro) deacylase)